MGTCLNWSQAEDLFKAGLRPPQNQRLLFTCSVALSCREPGTAPRMGSTRQETPGEATEGILLRATEPWVPAGWRGSPDGAVHRELQVPWASEPLAMEQRGGEDRGTEVLSPSGTLCPQLPSAPLKLPLGLGKKESQRQPVCQGPRLGGEGTATKSWRSTGMLATGDPRMVQVPHPQGPASSDGRLDVPCPDGSCLSLKSWKPAEPTLPLVLPIGRPSLESCDQVAQRLACRGCTRGSLPQFQAPGLSSHRRLRALGSPWQGRPRLRERVDHPPSPGTHRPLGREELLVTQQAQLGAEHSLEERLGGEEVGRIEPRSLTRGPMALGVWPLLHWLLAQTWPLPQ